jgi:hypothetical protein
VLRFYSIVTLLIVVALATLAFSYVSAVVKVASGQAYFLAITIFDWLQFTAFRLRPNYEPLADAERQVPRNLAPTEA